MTPLTSSWQTPAGFQNRRLMAFIALTLISLSGFAAGVILHVLANMAL